MNELITKITDFRNARLSDEGQRQYLGKMFRDWIEASETDMVDEGYHSKLLIDDLYYESKMVPLGFSEEHLQNFAYSNSGRLKTDQFETRKIDKGPFKGKHFVVKNKITDVIDRMDAKFADADRQYIIKADESQRNDKIELFTSRYLDKVSRKHQLWHQVHYPTIQQKHRRGLHWTQPLWNPNLNYHLGDMEWRTHPAQDVLLDPFPVQKYFLDARYIILKKRVPLDEARNYMAKFGIAPEDVVPDDDYFQYNTPERYHNQNQGGQYGELNDYVTLYYPEFKKTYIDKLGMPGEEGELEYEHTYYFKAVYHQTHGVLDFGINKYADISLQNAWQFSCIPWYEKLSNIHLHPISITEQLRHVQDIINIGWTFKLDGAIKQNMYRLFMKGKLTDKYKNLVNEFLNEYGGVFPMEGIDGNIRDNVMPFVMQSNDKGLMEFTEAMEESFNDQKGSNEVTGGRMPDTTKKYLSGESIKQTRADDFMRSQPSGLNVNWSASQEARRVYSILAIEKKVSYHYDDPEQETIDSDDKNNPNKTHYIPVNVTWNFEDYHKFLQDEYPDLIDMVDNPITGKKEPSYLKASAAFCKENWVKIKYTTKHPVTGKELELDEINSQGSEVRINHLFDTNGDKWKCDIKVEFDFGFKQDEESAKQLLGDLAKMVIDKYGVVASPILKRWLKLFPQIENEVDDMMKEIEQLDKNKQMIDEIQKRGPEFAQELSKLMQQYDMYQSQKQGQGKQASPFAIAS